VRQPFTFVVRRVSPTAGTGELLIAREWSILAGENDYTTDTFQQITCRPPAPAAEFLHEYPADFVSCPRVPLTRGSEQPGRVYASALERAA